MSNLYIAPKRGEDEDDEEYRQRVAHASVDPPASRGENIFFAAVHFAVFLSAVVLLAQGGGTSVDAGYVFSNSDDGMEVHAHSSSTVQAVTPVFLFLLGMGHSYLAYNPTEFWVGGVRVAPIASLMSVIVQPLIAVQVALYARVFDVEKVALMVFGTFVAVILDEIGWVVQRADQHNLPSPVRRMLAFGFYVGSGAMWLVLWVVTWTNLGWQYQQGNASTYALPVVLVVFLLFLARKLSYLFLFPRLKLSTTETLSYLCTVGVVCMLTFVGI